MNVLKNLWFWVSMILCVGVVWIYVGLTSQLAEMRKKHRCREMMVEEKSRDPDFFWFENGMGLRIAFKRVMVKACDIGKFVTDDTAVLTHDGKSFPLYWAGPRTLFYKADNNNRVKPARVYKLKFGKVLKCTDGSAYRGAREFKLKTTEFSLLDVRQSGSNGKLGVAEVALTFNAPCSATDLEEYLIVPTGQKYRITSKGYSVEHTLSLSNVVDGTVLEIGVAAGLPSDNPDFHITEDVMQKVMLKNQQLMITSLNAEREYFCGRGLRMDLNDRVDAAALRQYLELTPKVAWSIARQDGNRVYIKGNFKSDVYYMVTLQKGLSANNCRPLAREISSSVRFPALSRKVNFIDEDKLFLRTGGSMLVPVKSSSIKQLNVRVIRIYQNNTVWFLNSYYARGYRYGKNVFNHTFKVKNNPDKPTVSYIDLRKILKKPAPGVYEIYAQESGGWRSDHRRVILTNLGVTAKKAGNQVFVYVNRIDDSRPVEGADVQIISAKNQLLARSKSVKGQVVLNIPETALEESPIMVRVVTGNDVCQLRLKENKLSTAGFDVGGMKNPLHGYEAYTYAPRNLYRPGEMVNLFAIVRCVKVKLPGEFPVVMMVKSPDGATFKKITTLLKRDGSCEVAFKLPFSARTGWYRCYVSVPGNLHNKIIGRYKFLVDEFNPEKMKAVVSIKPREYKVGDRIKIRVRGEFLFGAPVAGGGADLKVSCYEMEFAPKEYSGYSFKASSLNETSFINRRLTSGKLNAGGEIVFTTKVPDWEAQTNYRAQYMVSVSIPSGGSTTGYKSVPVIKYKNLAGIKYLGRKRPEPGDKLKFGYVLLDSATGKKLESAPGNDLHLTIKRTNYRWKRSFKDGKIMHREVKEVTEVEKRTLLVNGADFTFAPNQQGKFTLMVYDPVSGHTADTTLFCYRNYYDYIYRSEQGVNGSSDDLKRISIKFGKAQYKHGDIMQLHLKSPIMGHGYVTIESNSVLDYYPFIADKPTVTLKIPAKSNYPFSFNVFAAVSRNPKVKSKIPGEFACGYVPVQLSKESQTLAVTLDVPDKQRPDSELDVKIMVKGSDGKPRAASLTLALIDEGVCRLTGFDTPSPLEHFYGKRGLRVDTFSVYMMLMENIQAHQISSDNILYGGGGVLSGMLRIARPEERKVAQIWRTNIKTGADGFASIKVKLPQFTGKLRVMAVAFTDNCFGNDTKFIKVADPLTSLTNFPTFLAPGDKAQAPISIFNNTGKDVKIDLNVGTQKYDMQLAKGGSRTLYHAIDASQNTGIMHYDLTASLQDGGKQWNRRIPVLLRSPYPPQAESVAGAFPASARNVNITIPGRWLKNSARGMLTLSTAPGLDLGDCLDYLVRYPYGCLEQTTSAAFCVLQVGELYNQLASRKKSEAQMKSYLQAGVDRMLTMQLYDGGFSMWPRGRKAWKWGSIYAADFLLQAKKNGCTVPDSTMRNIYNYLRNLSRKSRKPEIIAYALYVLSQAGKVKKSEVLGRLKADSKNGTTLSLSAMALLNVGLRKQALGIVENHIGPALRSYSNTGGTLSSSIRDDALGLLVLLKLRPDSPDIVKLAKRLMYYCRNKRYSTHDAAWALRALALYNKTIASVPSEFYAEVWQNGRIIGSLDTEKNQKGFVTLPVKVDGTSHIELRSQGRGRVYYRLAVAGIPASAPVHKDHGIIVRRKILNPDGSKAQLHDLHFGQLYLVKITLESRYNINNLVINDMLPGCFVIENAALATRDRNSAGRFKNTLKPTRVDPRFDRYLIFCDSKYPETKQVRTFYYAVRAAYKGRFALPSIFGTCMYDPKIYSNSSSGVITVK
jgi:alpha-2-macroglobulin